MKNRVTELHCIVPISTIPSVLKHGWLSHDKASRLKHTDVSNPDVQDRRKIIRVPGGLKLHRYANLYFDARNPMMYTMKERADILCVLRFSPDVVRISGVVITDKNASSDYPRFLSQTAITLLDFDMIYAEYWTHPNEIEYRRRKSMKCAEVLVPHRVSCAYIIGAYVVDAHAEKRLMDEGFTFPIATNPKMFFR